MHVPYFVHSYKLFLKFIFFVLYYVVLESNHILAAPLLSYFHCMLLLMNRHGSCICCLFCTQYLNTGNQNVCLCTIWPIWPNQYFCFFILKIHYLFFWTVYQSFYGLITFCTMTCFRFFLLIAFLSQ